MSENAMNSLNRADGNLPMDSKPITNVLDLARLTLESETEVEQLATQIRRRRLIKKLMAIRASRGLSQQDIAKKMHVTQSKISKLERTFDDSLSLGDFRDYLSAVDLDVRMVICPKSWPATEQIKYHVHQIRDCLKRLVGIAQKTDDPSVRQGIHKFHVEAIINMLVPVLESIKNLPRLAVGTSEFIDVESDSPGEGFEQDDESPRSHDCNNTQPC